MGDVPDQLDLGDEELINLGRDAVDRDDLLVALGVPVLGGVLDQVVADRHHQVGVLEPGHLVVAGLEPDGPQGLRILVVDQPLGHERLGHRNAGRLGERSQRAAGVASMAPLPASATGFSAASISSAARWSSRPPGSGCTLGWRGSGEASSGLHHHVLGQLEMSAPGLLGFGDLECLADDLGDDLRLQVVEEFQVASMHRRVVMRLKVFEA